MKKLLLPLLTIFSAYTAPEQSLSVNDTISIIWTLNCSDTRELYKTVFPEVTSDRRKADNYLDMVIDKMDKAFDKTINTMDKVWKAIARKIFGKTLKERLLETYFSATPQEQEMIKKAVQGSYDEYYPTPSLVGIIATIVTFPIGPVIALKYAIKHIDEVEAKRAMLRKAA